MLLKKLETRLVSHLDSMGGINNISPGLDRLVDSMKGETLLDGKIYELKILNATTNE